MKNGFLAGRPLFLPWQTVFLLMQSQEWVNTQLSSKKIFWSKNGPYFKMAEKILKNQFLAGRPLFFAWQTVFLFHQIKHWVDIHLWAKGFSSEIGPSAGIFFFESAKIGVFQFLASRLLFFAWQTVFYLIKSSIGLISSLDKRIFSEIGHSAGKFFLKVPKFVFLS